MNDLENDWLVERDLHPDERVPDDLPYESTDPEDELLIRWLLSHTPGERLAIADDWAQGALALRNGRRTR